MFVVIESTPGYMPDSEPYPIGTRREALRVMVDMMRECRDMMREGGADVGGWLDRDAGAGFLVDEGRPHDLGRYFSIEPCEGGITPEGLALGHRYVMGHVNAYCPKCSDAHGVCVLDCDYDLDK